MSTPPDPSPRSKPNIASAQDEYSRLETWLDEYYAILISDESFKEDLKALFEQYKDSLFTHGPLSSSEKQLKAQQEALWSSVAEKTGYVMGEAVEDWRRPEPELEAAMLAFAEKWKLPRRAHEPTVQCRLPDLYMALLDYQDEQGLRLCSQRSMRIGMPAKVITVRSDDPGFKFSPTYQSISWARAEAKAYVERVKAEVRKILDSAEQAAREAGIHGFPPHHAGSESRGVLLRRLYSRAVLGRTWREIAEDDIIGVEGIEKSVIELARILGVPLPRQQGRRPKAK